MLKNIVPALIQAGKFTGRVVSGTLVAMGTVKTVEAIADGLRNWRNNRAEKKAAQQEEPAKNSRKAAASAA